jgi:zinc transport system ATP-binding protein
VTLIPDKVIEFDNVCFAYDRQEILHNVNFDVKNKDLVALVGPNGAGKSTILKLILGLFKPLRGSIKVFNKEPAEARGHIGYVPQYLLFDTAFPVGVLDVVLMGRVDKHLFGPYRRADKAAALEALEKVQMENFSKRGFSELSGGERQRVLIAQAIVSRPDLLLLDEPTANVDVQVEHEIYELLHRLNLDMTVLMVSHNLNVVISHASHVICVNRTVSKVPIDEITEAKLHSVFRGDIAVLHHHESCHVIDSSGVMKEPHKAEIRKDI